MRIVLVGAGKVGGELCKDLSSEDHDVFLIERNAKKLEFMLNTTDITGILGNGAISSVQLEAGVDHADVFIAVAQDDETNIIAAITAKKLGARYCVARVRDPEFSGQMNFVSRELGISLMINPEREAARVISQMIQFPSALGVEQFNSGRVSLVEVRIAKTSPLAGIQLSQLKGKGHDVLVCAVNRDGKCLIPNGKTILAPDDAVYITGLPKNLDRFYHDAGSYKKRLQSALIIGSGRITNYLIPRLLKLGMKIKVIESNEDCARLLADEFPSVEVVIGDGTDQAFLLEERLPGFDCTIALTGVDEENLMISFYAHRHGIKKTITKVNRTALLKVVDENDLDSIITPRRLISDIILRYVRALSNTKGSNIEALYRLADNQAEALQFHVTADSRVTNTPLCELKTRDNVMVALIVRKEQLIFPGGQNMIKPGDRVLVVSLYKNLQNIDDILR